MDREDSKEETLLSSHSGAFSVVIDDLAAFLSFCVSHLIQAINLCSAEVKALLTGLPPSLSAGTTMGSSDVGIRVTAAMHLGIRCDNCGTLPITGIRYKSLARADYDLCARCILLNTAEPFMAIVKPLDARSPLNFYSAQLDAALLRTLTRLKLLARDGHISEERRAAHADTLVTEWVEQQQAQLHAAGGSLHVPPPLVPQQQQQQQQQQREGEPGGAAALAAAATAAMRAVAETASIAAGSDVAAAAAALSDGRGAESMELRNLASPSDGAALMFHSGELPSLGSSAAQPQSGSSSSSSSGGGSGGGGGASYAASAVAAEDAEAEPEASRQLLITSSSSSSGGNDNAEPLSRATFETTLAAAAAAPAAAAAAPQHTCAAAPPLQLSSLPLTDSHTLHTHTRAPATLDSSLLIQSVGNLARSFATGPSSLSIAGGEWSVVTLGAGGSSSGGSSGDVRCADAAGGSCKSEERLV
ncbi:hypothetical protein JKP88DRAFT_322886 [Tribonema minus]|uniref:ZZ-type domain-containing protein n=1 Tax=Tribonema minus TaxID=303371 RepID=A0A835YT41_9STRA|nr:hypothetical protein JKP88DRAFT_322886 [Tribonema minus]